MQKRRLPIVEITIHQHLGTVAFGGQSQNLLFTIKYRNSTTSLCTTYIHCLSKKFRQGRRVIVLHSSNVQYAFSLDTLPDDKQMGKQLRGNDTHRKHKSYTAMQKIYQLNLH